MPGEPTPQPRTGAVLVIDDDSSVRAALEQMLSDGGFDVIASAGTDAAFAVLQSGARIALVLLDLNMPGVDGRAFRRMQLADPRLAEIPTVVLTGAGLQQVDDTTLQATDYLLKPVGREHLISVVSAYCKRSDQS